MAMWGDAGRDRWEGELERVVGMKPGWGTIAVREDVGGDEGNDNDGDGSDNDGDDGGENVDGYDNDSGDGVDIVEGGGNDEERLTKAGRGMAVGGSGMTVVVMAGD